MRSEHTIHYEDLEKEKENSMWTSLLAGYESSLAGSSPLPFLFWCSSSGLLQCWYHYFSAKISARNPFRVGLNKLTTTDVLTICDLLAWPFPYQVSQDKLFRRKHSALVVPVWTRCNLERYQTGQLRNDFSSWRVSHTPFFGISSSFRQWPASWAINQLLED